MKSRLQQDEDICYLCGKYMTEKNVHHILNGAYRHKCEADQLVCFVHPTCHRYIHDHAMTARTLKQRAQRCYEREIGTRKQFINRYGKSYL